MFNKDFTVNMYLAILGNLRGKGYLTQKDCDILKINALKEEIGHFDNISKEEADIVRKAIFENSTRKKFK